jgi:hypothetical protein
LECPPFLGFAERVDGRLSRSAPDTAAIHHHCLEALHIADGNTIYWEHSFGPGQRNFWDLAPHGDASGGIEYLRDSQVLISSTLAELDDAELDVLHPTHFGNEWPAGRVLAVLINEQVHHGAEVAVMRDLYRYRVVT